MSSEIDPEIIVELANELVEVNYANFVILALFAYDIRMSFILLSASAFGPDDSRSVITFDQEVAQMISQT